MTAFTLTSGGVTLAVSPCWRITRGRKIWSNAPDFRSPMFEPSVPQNNNDLAAERGPPAMCGIDLPSVRSTIFLLGIAPAWCVLSAKTGICPPSTRCRPVSLLRFQCSAILLMPGRLGENPIRANVRGSHCFPRELAPPKIGSISRHLTRLPLIPSGMRDAIQFIGRARKRWIWRWSATLV